MSVETFNEPQFGDTYMSTHNTGDGKWWKLPYRRPFRGQIEGGWVTIRDEGVIEVHWMAKPLLVVNDDPWYVYRVVRRSDGATLYRSGRDHAAS